MRYIALYLHIVEQRNKLRPNLGIAALEKSGFFLFLPDFEEKTYIQKEVRYVEHIAVKKKIDRIIITHKIAKTEQINSMELDIINRGEIPALLPVQVSRKLGGKRFRFVVESLTDLRAFLKSGIDFKMFAQIVLQIVDTLQQCEAHGIRCGNLELNCDLSYYDYNRKRVRLIYWPLISLSAYSNAAAYFMELGSVYIADGRDSDYRVKYLQFFDSRAKFDLEAFKQHTEYLLKQWQQVRSGRKSGGNIIKKTDDLPPTVGLMTATLQRKSNQTMIQIDHYPFSLGRNPKFCDYAIGEDVFISKRHVTILLRNGQPYIRDNGSSNGTRLNGMPLPANVDMELASGSVFQIGKEEFVFFAAGG